MSKWAEFYKSRVGDTYPIYCMARYAPLIEELEKDEPIHYVEEGCGIGTISKLLSWRNPKREIIASDSDIDILKLCKHNLWPSHPLVVENNDPLNTGWVMKETIKWKESSVMILHDDMIRQAKYQTPCNSVVFSHGVLEHHTDISIQHILERQQTQSRKIVHYVPTDGYDKPSFGDERLLPMDYWVDTWKPTRHTVFNKGKDLILVWE